MVVRANLRDRDDLVLWPRTRPTEMIVFFSGCRSAFEVHEKRYLRFGRGG